MTALKVSCPMFKNGEQCEGALELVTTFHTDMGIHQGVDRNSYTQIFKCPVCSAKVSRTYEWKEEE
jgi:hypothetical protein